MPISQITRKIPLDFVMLELLQRDMERDSHRTAMARAHKKLLKLQERKREGDGAAADPMINWAIGDVAKALRKWEEETSSLSKRGKPSYEARLAKFYKQLTNSELNEVVSSGLGTCFNGISGGVPVSRAAFEIGRRIENTVMMRQVRYHDDKLYKRMVNRMRQKGEESKRTDVLSFTVRVNNINHDPFPEHIKLALGLHFIHFVVNVTGYFQLHTQNDGLRSVQILLLTPEAARAMNAGTLAIIKNAALYEPMVVPPINWERGVVSGAGYLTTEQPPISLVKTKSRKYLRDLSNINDPRLDVLFSGLAGAQGTGWRIRPNILKILQRLIRMETSIGGMPELTFAEAVPAPINAERAADLLSGWNVSMGNRKDWIAQLNEFDRSCVEKFLDHKKREQLRHKQNIELQGRWVGVARNLATAAKYAEFDSIYIPHQVDFRCRVYGITQGGISPQGEDYVKGLLEFDVGMELGERGWYWLRWHTANVWGEDKAAHADRVKWTDEHLAMIRMVASDPLQYRNWEHADKPFQFLACCFEIYEAMQTEGGPVKFHSRMPIALDGSCSGLQHLGMATRCETTGRAVNLLAGDKPSDIYQIVADKVAAYLDQVVSGELPVKKEGWQEQAAKWVSWSAAWKNGKLSRSITKRSVMTYPYGSAEYGFGNQILEDTLEPAFAQAQKIAQTLGKEVKDVFPWADEAELNTAARCMAWLVYKSVVETVDIPAQIMQWLKQMARLVVKSKAPVKWTTPLGFPVVQSYYKQDDRTIDGVLYGKKRIQVQYKTATKELDRAKQVNGIAPNVVHSLDSTHLLMTVDACLKEGIKHFALIHDSFGTHAANTDQMFRIVREQMVELYNGNYFESLKEELTELVPLEFRDQIPPLPAMGTMDHTQLVNSPYAFS
ncbi:DNA-directed RNA polymerase [Aeromonas veronii]|uniref:DNA-directed RNA polymerase n=1 Tax=Aeromonas veronii TaxID=654 RepID=UPI003B9E0AC0